MNATIQGSNSSPQVTLNLSNANVGGSNSAASTPLSQVTSPNTPRTPATPDSGIPLFFPFLRNKKPKNKREMVCKIELNFSFCQCCFK